MKQPIYLMSCVVIGVVLTIAGCTTQEKLTHRPRRLRERKSRHHKGAAPRAEYSTARKSGRVPRRDKETRPDRAPGRRHNTESYDRIRENPFLSPRREPLSTFAIDVDSASYALVRRFLRNNRLPVKGAVRIEELINYFSYDYPAPDGKHPFSITTEYSACPWKKGHQLVLVGLQGKKVSLDHLPPSNLVFLLDVSGSMRTNHKLPLLKKAFSLLIDNMRDEDRVAIVVYAGSSGVVLPSTSGAQKKKILRALDGLRAGGSTAGSAGIQLAYKIARDHFKKGGNNRVILATDGDFNVGPSSQSELVRLIEDKRRHGIFLSVLGFGSGNYKDSRMEKLANKGNGNYAYIDSILEAKKVLVREIGGTLLTIAKDVKIQVEFNPAKVNAYRLIGYENRLLRARDFNDDTKDAGELGAGHSVTALYEIVPTGVKIDLPNTDKLKYQSTKGAAEGGDELLTVKFRYKPPKASKSRLIVRTLKAVPRDMSRNMRFAAAAAGFGMMLRESKHKGNMTWPTVRRLARAGKGEDPNGYRGEFLRLIERAETLEQAARR